MRPAIQEPSGRFTVQLERRAAPQQTDDALIAFVLLEDTSDLKCKRPANSGESENLLVSLALGNHLP